MVSEPSQSATSVALDSYRYMHGRRGFARVAILFSGGLDSTVLAALTDRCVLLCVCVCVCVGVGVGVGVGICMYACMCVCLYTWLWLPLPGWCLHQTVIVSPTKGH